MANINKIRVSGTTYNIQDSNAPKTVELTQAQYDALVDKDSNTFYVITDAQAGDLTNYYTKSETNTLLGGKADTATTYTKTEVDTALGGKQATLVSGTNIKTINNESILGSGNIDIQGGSSYTAGDGIDITNDVISVTGKADTSAVTEVSDAITAHTANTTVHVTAQDKTNWNNKSNFSGDYNDLTNKPTIPTVPTNVSDFTNDAGYITSDDISGKTNQSDFTAHTANTTVHVTASEKSTWNSKSDFSGNYNDLSNKPTIPTSASQLTNDSGYITSSALDDYTTTATTSALNNVVTAHTANTSIHVSAEQIAAWNAKSDFSGSYNDLTNKLSAGTNITIVDNVISAEGGGSVTIDPTLDSGSTNAVANSAITTALNNKQIYNSSGYFYDVTTSYQNSGGKNTDYIRFKAYKNDGSTTNVTKLYFPRINGNKLVSVAAYYTDFQLLETSAITTSITSGSTDSQVPSAKAVYDQLGGLKLVKLTQQEYDALSPNYDNNTLYIIT